jgi:ATP-dependent DNA helicase RecQ
VLQAVEKIVGDLRNELVYFRLQDLTAKLDMEQPAVAHALYELNESDWFSYVPPFRGRAIRMLKRDVPFEQLEIDIEALEKRKAAEYDKLNRMVRFALSGGCRQQEILRYFGESDAPACQHCDNCAKRSIKRSTRPDSKVTRGAGVPPAVAAQAGRLHHDDRVSSDEGVVEAVRIVLSGVARTESRVPCGKNVIAQMLCGSDSAKMKKLGMNRLSTFGLLRQLKQPEVVTLIDVLIANRCLEQENIDRFRPVVKLTPLGGDVMRGKAEVPAGLNLPRDLRLKLQRPVAKHTAKPKIAEEAAGSKLSKTREPPSREHPSDETAWIAAEGSSEYDDFQSDFEIEAPEYVSQADDEPAGSLREVAAAPTPRDVQPASALRPPYYWTWRLLSQGFLADECLAIRGITREALLDHLLQAAENGLEINRDWCLSPQTIAALDALVADGPPPQIRPLLAQLPPGTRYEEVQIYLKCRHKRTP